jgi:enterochelin esterase-like enzyme
MKTTPKTKPRGSKIWWFGLGLGVVSSLFGAVYGYVFVAGAPQWDAPAVKAESGINFQVKTFPSKAMGGDRNYGVILPPDYESSPQKRYPVIVLLHGGHDNERAFYDKYGFGEILHQLYQTQKLTPSVIVMPDGNDNRGSNPITDPDYFDGPNGRVGTLLGQELPQLIQSRYRVRPEATYWAIGGVSSGGWGACTVMLQQMVQGRDRFRTCFSHSGYFTDASGPANSPNTLIRNIPASKRQLLRFYIDAGKSDPNLLASSRQFHQTLTALKVANQFYEFPGGHGLSGPDYGWNYFRKHLPQALTYVGQAWQP